jgi:predicted Holliday junction resolvase-like endonuclease
LDKDTLSAFLVLAILAIAVLAALSFSLATKVKASNTKVIALEGQIPAHAQRLYDQWRNRDITAIQTEQRNTAQREATVQLQQWKIEQEYTIRQDAIHRSQSVIIGKVTEHLSPYIPTFPFNPKDARFIGAPIDFLVFDGLDDGNIREIVFVEVKTGNSSLNPKQRQIRDAVLAQRVQWRE